MKKPKTPQRIIDAFEAFVANKKFYTHNIKGKSYFDIEVLRIELSSIITPDDVKNIRWDEEYRNKTKKRAKEKGRPADTADRIQKGKNRLIQTLFKTKEKFVGIKVAGKVKYIRPREPGEPKQKAKPNTTALIRTAFEQNKKLTKEKLRKLVEPLIDQPTKKEREQAFTKAYARLSGRLGAIVEAKNGLLIFDPTRRWDTEVAERRELLRD